MEVYECTLRLVNPMFNKNILTTLEKFKILECRFIRIPRISLQGREGKSLIKEPQ